VGEAFQIKKNPATFIDASTAASAMKKNLVLFSSNGTKNAVAARTAKMDTDISTRVSILMSCSIRLDDCRAT